MIFHVLFNIHYHGIAKKDSHMILLANTKQCLATWTTFTAQFDGPSFRAFSVGLAPDLG